MGGHFGAVILDLKIKLVLQHSEKNSITCVISMPKSTGNDTSFAFCSIHRIIKEMSLFFFTIWHRQALLPFFVHLVQESYFFLTMTIISSSRNDTSYNYVSLDVWFKKFHFSSFKIALTAILINRLYYLAIFGRCLDAIFSSDGSFFFKLQFRQISLACGTNIFKRNIRRYFRYLMPAFTVIRKRYTAKIDFSIGHCHHYRRRRRRHHCYHRQHYLTLKS